MSDQITTSIMVGLLITSPSPAPQSRGRTLKASWRAAEYWFITTLRLRYGQCTCHRSSKRVGLSQMALLQARAAQCRQGADASDCPIEEGVTLLRISPPRGHAADPYREGAFVLSARSRARHRYEKRIRSLSCDTSPIRAISERLPTRSENGEPVPSSRARRNSLPASRPPSAHAATATTTRWPRP
jgi:hypothetical protein